MKKPPKYRRHSTRNKGFVEYQKHRFYFPGNYNSAESLKAYAEFIQDLVSVETDTNRHKNGPDLRITHGDDITVTFLVGRFLDYAEKYYVKNGRSTGTYEKFSLFIEPLNRLFGDTNVSDFGPLDLKKVRNEFVSAGLCRNSVNERTSKICQIFSWGVENELVPVSVAGALRYVKGIRKGETAAKETVPIAPIDNKTLFATLPFLPPTVDDMVVFQHFTGCRPNEVRNLRWCNIDQSDPDVWIYTPWEHKTEHHGKSKIIAITKPAQKILEKYRHRPADAFIFSPRETIRLTNEKKRKEQKTNVPLSQVKRKDKWVKNPKRKVTDQYTRGAYEHAITRACRAADVEEWSPNRIRHTFVTTAREQLGAEAAQALLGHANLSTTEIYAEKTLKLIKETAKRLIIDVKPADGQ